MNMQANISLIQQVSDDLRDMMGEDFDEETFWDSLDGETDAADLLDALLLKRAELLAHSEASKAVADQYKSRADRLKSGADAVKAAMGSILSATGEKKASRPLGTISVSEGRMSAVITDEGEVPSQLCKVVRTPDKAAIKKQLEAGEHVPGADLVRGDAIITVRTK